MVRGLGLGGSTDIHTVILTVLEGVALLTVVGSSINATDKQSYQTNS